MKRIHYHYARDEEMRYCGVPLYRNFYSCIARRMSRTSRFFTFGRLSSTPASSSTSSLFLSLYSLPLSLASSSSSSPFLFFFFPTPLLSALTAFIHSLLSFIHRPSVSSQQSIFSLHFTPPSYRLLALRSPSVFPLFFHHFPPFSLLLHNLLQLPIFPGGSPSLLILPLLPLTNSLLLDFLLGSGPEGHRSKGSIQWHQSCRRQTDGQKSPRVL